MNALACSGIDPDHPQFDCVSPLSRPFSLKVKLQPSKSSVPLSGHIVQPAFRFSQTGGAGNKPRLAPIPLCLDELSSFKDTQMTRYRLSSDRQTGGQLGD